VAVDSCPSGEHDAGGDVARVLRAVARTDQRGTEQSALRDAWRSRSFVQVFEQSMQRGDRVVLHLRGGPALRGVLVDSGRDFVTLASDAPTGTRIDVHVVSDGQDTGQVALEVIGRATVRGTRGTGDGFLTFADRLDEYAHLTGARPARQVVVAHRAAELGWSVVRGELRAFALDHLYLGTPGGELFVPTVTVAYVHWAEKPPADH
jgi:hypothetical protein